MRRISSLVFSNSGRLAVPALIFLILAGCAGPKRTPPVGTEPVISPTSPPAYVPGTPTLLGVGLLENQPSVVIATLGPALLLDGSNGKRLARLDGPGEVKCTLSGGQVAWQAQGAKGSAAVVVLQPVDPADRVTEGAFEYRGEFQVKPSPRGGGLTLVNSLDLENYLRGVVPWEIGRHKRDRMAALEAQAVAARTYTISHLGTRKSRGFDVYASVQDQVYKGAKDEDALCNEAVDNTAGMVLQSAGKEIDAYYSACCGGYSSYIEEVWSRDPQAYLISKPDAPAAGGEAFCAESRHFHWRETWTAGKLEEIMRKTLPEYVSYISQPHRKEWAGQIFSPRDGSSRADKPGRLINLEILSQTTSGRVAELAVTTEAGVYHVRGDRVRWVLKPASGNPFILRSALFEVELVRDGDRLTEVAARGRGYGHGIGLCQTGALTMAEKGYDSRQILFHYYPGTELVEVAR